MIFCDMRQGQTTHNPLTRLVFLSVIDREFRKLAQADSFCLSNVDRCFFFKSPCNTSLFANRSALPCDVMRRGLDTALSC